VLYWNKILKVFIPIRICWICWHYLLTREGKSFKGKFFSLCCSYQAKTSQFIRSFLYVFTCIFIYLSIHFKIVWPQVLSSQATCRSRRCYHNKEKGTVTSQNPNLCLWGTWKFSPKNLRTEKIPRQLIFISIKAFSKTAVHKRKFSAELFTIQVIVIEEQL